MKSRLGAQATNAKLTDAQIVARGKKAYQGFIQATTPEQRLQWTREGAAKVNAASTQEEKQARGRRAQAIRMIKTTQEQRTEWARKAGKARAAQRAAQKEATWTEST